VKDLNGKWRQQIPTNRLLWAFSALIALFVIIGLTYKLLGSDDNETAADREIAPLSIAQFNDPEGLVNANQLAEKTFEPLSGNYINLGGRNSVWLKIRVTDAIDNVDKLASSILLIKRNNINTTAQLVYLTQASGWQSKYLPPTAEFPNRLLIKIPNDIISSDFYLRLNGQYLRASINVISQPDFFR
jgi:hypothetical protein